MSADTSLDDLRRKIDAIDDQIHDLLMERTKIVEGVRKVKKGQRIKIRPSREDDIAFRLIERHEGAFPKRELFRIWREIIVATLGFEGPFSVVVHTSGEDCGAWDLARDHYGAYTPMTSSGSFHQVIEAVRTQEATVGILPVPRQDDDNPWWRHLLSEAEDAPRIISRLPFAGPSNTRLPDAEGLVICPIDREPTGRDRSYVALDSEAELRSGKVREALEEAGFEVRFTSLWQDPHIPGLSMHLAEVEGFVGRDDGRLEGCRDLLGKAAGRILSLGGYAIPLKPEELA